VVSERSELKSVPRACQIKTQKKFPFDIPRARAISAVLRDARDQFGNWQQRRASRRHDP
jgi:hypothetical protein